MQILDLVGMYFDPVVLSRSQEEFTFIQIGSHYTVLCCLIRTDFSKSDEFFAVSEETHGTNSKYLGTDVEF